jgi:hypothetical protein
MNRKRPIIEGLLKGRFSLMLGTMALMFFVVPLFPEDQAGIDKTVGLFTLVVLISCLRAISQSRRFFVFMLLLSLINVGIGSAEIYRGYETDLFQTVVLVFKLVFFLLVFFSIMRYVLDDSPVC